MSGGRRPPARRLTLAPLSVIAGDLSSSEDGECFSSSLRKEESVDPVVGFRSRLYGSRFWSLADELSSDEDEEDGGQIDVVDNGSRKSVTGLMPDRPMNEMQAASVDLTEVPHDNRKVRVLSGVAGHGDKQRRAPDDAGQVRQREAPKPWRGPLLKR
ncbi:unnamed protein product [Urochloa humidicola]